MAELPGPEDIFNGILPEDNVTEDVFYEAVKALMNFTQIKSTEVHTLYDLAQVTRDLGLSVQRIVLSCGVPEINHFSYVDPRIVNRGQALINAGDTNLGQGVKEKAETHLTAATMVIRTKKPDGSSTITTVSAHHIGDLYSQTQMIINERFERGRQLTNYYAAVPVNVETDKMMSPMSVVAIDFRNTQTRSYYPLKNPSEIQGYTGVLHDLVQDLLQHLTDKKFLN